MEELRLEGDPPVTKWGGFKTLMNSQFYPSSYVEEWWNHWNYFRQIQEKNVQEYTIEFNKMDIMMGISPKNPNVLLNYMGFCIVIYERKWLSVSPRWRHVFKNNT